MKKLLMIIACLGLLSGCGQMGPLVPADKSDNTAKESQ
jgi:predicted small lipoprotein YifL